MIYLDNAATTMPKPATVYGAVSFALHQCAGAGRSGHDMARAAEEQIFICRQSAAELFDCQPEQVVLSFHATHALNMAISTLVSPGDLVVVSGFEHNAVIRPLSAIGARIRVARGRLFDRQAVIDAFSDALTEDVRAVICNHVSNVFGFVLPLEEISQLCKKKGVPLIVDASQSAGILPISLTEMQAAFIAMPGHKSLYGPQGTGILLCNRPLKSFIHGGTGSLSVEPLMPKELPDAGEAGTHNVPGIAGLAAGLQFVKHVGTEKLLRHDQILATMAGRELEKLPGIQVFMDREGAQCGVLSFLVKGQDCEDTAASLARCGFAVRAGLHCAPHAHLTAGTLRTGTVRVSMSIFNTEGEILRFLDTMQRLSGREFIVD